MDYKGELIDRQTTEKCLATFEYNDPDPKELLPDNCTAILIQNYLCMNLLYFALFYASLMILCQICANFMFTKLNATFNLATGLLCMLQRT